MSDYHTTEIRVKHVSNAHIEKDAIIVLGAADSPTGLESSLGATIDASHNDGADEAHDRAQRKYDPSEYDDGTVLARVEPNGEVHWPLEETDDDA